MFRDLFAVAQVYIVRPEYSMHTKSPSCMSFKPNPSRPFSVAKRARLRPCVLHSHDPYVDSVVIFAQLRILISTWHEGPSQYSCSRGQDSGTCKPVSGCCLYCCKGSITLVGTNGLKCPHGCIKYYPSPAKRRIAIN